MTDQIHSCSYYCHIPSCVKAQRDELRDKFVAIPDTHRVVSVEFLDEILRRCYVPFKTEDKLRAIIDKEKTE
jgi:hypothetical protein